MKQKLLIKTLVICLLSSQLIHSQKKLDCDFNFREALFYLKGDQNLKKDSLRSIEYLQPCLKVGDANAQLLMGKLYAAKKDEESYKKAFKLFKKSAKQGNPIAMVDLGILYKYGRGCNLNFNNARKWFKKASKLGNGKATYSLGYLYLKGFGNIKQNYSEAVKWFEKSNYSMAKYWLGYCYYYGFGVQKNIEKAKELIGDNFTEESLENSLISLSNDSEIKVYKKLQKLEAKTYSSVTISDQQLFGKWSGNLFQLDWSGKHIIHKTSISLNFIIDTISQKPLYHLTTERIETKGNLNKIENTIYFENLYIPLAHVVFHKNLPDTLNYQILSSDLLTHELDGETYLTGSIKDFIYSWDESGAPINIVLKKKKTFTNSNEELSEDALEALTSQKNNFIKLYPNPFQRHLIISYTLKEASMVSISITDMKGTKTTIIEKGKSQQEGSYQYYFNGSHLEKGMYIIRIQTNETTKTRVIVKK